MLETAARASDAVERGWTGGRTAIQSVWYGAALHWSQCVRFDERQSSREKLGMIKERFNRPQGAFLTHREPQMNMLQDGDGHLNQAVALRIELNETIAVEEDLDRGLVLAPTAVSLFHPRDASRPRSLALHHLNYFDFALTS